MMTPSSPSADDGARFVIDGFVVHDKLKKVDIQWRDGHLTTMPFWYVRGLCPCAVCQGHGQTTRFVPGAVPPDDLALPEIMEVGHYAINLVWNDGHKTGIFSFVQLRHLCPCMACQREKAQHHPARLLPTADAVALESFLHAKKTSF